MNALVYHIDDCTRPPSRRLLAIDICSGLVVKKPGAECNHDSSNTYNRNSKKTVQQEGMGGTEGDSSSSLSITLIEEAFHSALIRRLDDPSNVSLMLMCLTNGCRSEVVLFSFSFSFNPLVQPNPTQITGWLVLNIV